MAAEESKSSLEDSSSTQTDEDSTPYPQAIDESPTHELLTKEVLESTAKDFASYLIINDRQDVRLDLIFHTESLNFNCVNLCMYIILEKATR